MVDPSAGAQIVTERLAPVPEQSVRPCAVTVADELLLPPAPVAVVEVDVCEFEALMRNDLENGVPEDCQPFTTIK